jgi:fibronectin type 3 domain-containing protein
VITPAGFDRITFTDTNVETGKTYYYYVRAIDKAGNKSDPSRVVSATVP